MRRRECLSAAGLVLAAPAGAAPHKKTSDVQVVVAETSRGRVRGVNNDGIRTFKGIPYAASTEGANRFRAAKQAVAWTGIRDAIAYGPVCPQDTGPRPAILSS